jgi:hypothetical protein
MDVAVDPRGRHGRSSDVIFGGALHRGASVPPGVLGGKGLAGAAARHFGKAGQCKTLLYLFV